MAVTWTELEARIRQRSDNEYASGNFVEPSELLILANVARKQLFGMLVEAGLHSVAETEYTIPVDGSLNYALPDDCFAVSGVFRVESESYLPLRRHSQRIHPRDSVESVATSYRNHGMLENAVLELNPRVDSGTYIMRYIGVPTDLAVGADTMDGVLGWEEWVVLDVARKVLTKEKIWEAVSSIRGDQLMLAQEIRSQAADRDMQEGIQIADVRNGGGDSLFDDDGYLPGGRRDIQGYWGGLF